MEQPQSNKKLVAIIGLVVIVAVIGIGVAVTVGKKLDSADDATPTPVAAASPSTEASPAATAGTYKDGTYSATGSYTSPGGHETIKISVTLKGGAITDTSAVSGANDSDAKHYQSLFIDGYKSQVVGKSVDSVKLSRVSGASLTSGGFNDALAQIKSQAKS